ncbi:MAG: AAA family ATPase [Chloroflexota bacterium]|nr:AAA family ATPase [Chloroflexota bacterium]
MATLTPDDVARQLRISPETVRRYIRDGQLPAQKVGGQYRIASTDLAIFTGATGGTALPRVAVIAVTNQKGGVGKTTTAVAVAAALRDLDQRVLLIDADPQGNATAWLGFDRAQRYLSLYEILKEAAQPTGDADLSPAIVVIEPGLDLVPAHINMTALDIELVGALEREWLLHDLVRALEGRYDYIVIDLPPTLTLLAVASLLAADSVLIPQVPDAVSVQGLGQLLDTLRHLRRAKRKRQEDLTVLGVLLTQVRANTDHHRQYRTFIAEFCTAREIPFLSAPSEQTRGQGDYVEIPATIRAPDAAGRHIPLSRYPEGREAAAAYRKLAHLLIPMEAAHV